MPHSSARLLYSGISKIRLQWRPRSHTLVLLSDRPHGSRTSLSSLCLKFNTSFLHHDETVRPLLFPDPKSALHQTELSCLIRSSSQCLFEIALLITLLLYFIRSSYGECTTLHSRVLYVNFSSHPAQPLPFQTIHYPPHENPNLVLYRFHPVSFVTVVLTVAAECTAKVVTLALWSSSKSSVVSWVPLQESRVALLPLNRSFSLWIYQRISCNLLLVLCVEASVSTLPQVLHFIIPESRLLPKRLSKLIILIVER